MMTFPHCDSSILHAPGECEFCDMCPEWQQYRLEAGIGFTGQDASDRVTPCPSTWFRNPQSRDRWPGNTPYLIQAQP